MGKQVKIPRFYVDMVSFLHATGQTTWDSTYSYGGGGVDLLYMNPSNPHLIEMEPDYDHATFYIGKWHNDENPFKTSFPINFCALLNHNLSSIIHDARCSVQGIRRADGGGISSMYLHSGDGYTGVLNTNPSWENQQSDMGATFNGTSIFTFSDKNGLDRMWTEFRVTYERESDALDEMNFAQLGSMVIGKYWDAPNSPDLSLTMSRRFEGIKRQKTIGGKTLANIYYDGPTEWTMYHPLGPDDLNPSGIYKYPPFELDSPNSASDWDNDDTYLDTVHARAKSGLGRKGLRSLNFTFSYISEDDMWTDYESSSTAPFIDDGWNSEIDGDAPIDPEQRKNPMLSDDSFNFVWNCTLGGTLPFIFQPDNTNNNPDQFSICTFRGNSLSVKQVAFNTYNLSVTIDEVA